MLLFCPNQTIEQSVAQANRQQLLMSLEKASRLSSGSSIVQSPAKRPLPSPGMPISILDFAEMTVEEQKIWLQGGKQAGDTGRGLNTNTNTSRKPTKHDQQGWTVKSTKNSFNTASVETERALPGLDDSSISEESQETNSVSSATSSSSIRSDDALVEKRSIFAPYWGQETSLSPGIYEHGFSSKKHQVPRRVTAFPRPPSPITSRNRFLMLHEEQPLEHKVMTMLEELSFSNCYSVFPSSKARSMPSILRNSSSGDERRPIRRCQSVSFDARVDVIVYQEQSPQGEWPWWLFLRSFGR